MFRNFNALWYSCDMEEKKDEEDSTLNEGEAEISIAHARRLVQSGVQASDIGIITPYAAQVLLMFSSWWLKADMIPLHMVLMVLLLFTGCLLEDVEMQSRQTKRYGDLYCWWLPGSRKRSHHHFNGSVKLKERGSLVIFIILFALAIWAASISICKKIIM